VHATGTFLYVLGKTLALVNEHGIQGFKTSWEQRVRIFARNDLCIRKGLPEAKCQVLESMRLKKN
jgi:hypothetical protein